MRLKRWSITTFRMFFYAIENINIELKVIMKWPAIILKFLDARTDSASCQSMRWSLLDGDANKAEKGKLLFFINTFFLMLELLIKLEFSSKESFSIDQIPNLLLIGCSGCIRRLFVISKMLGSRNFELGCAKTPAWPPAYEMHCSNFAIWVWVAKAKNRPLNNWKRNKIHN